MRYGGEEFVLLLPNTDAEGCEQVGQKVRAALHEFGMLHALNPPSKRVTVSLGGATNLPAGGSVDFVSLVEAADRALYTAKDNGRDRLVMSGQVIAWPGAKSA
jgi:diguanylate cyclase (GGDEF)-like protein